MPLTKENRVAVLLHKGILNFGGKTGLTFLRYSEVPVVAVIDQDCVGRSFRELTGIPKDVPIVASVTDALAYNPDVLLIGIAPTGGKLPNNWMQEIMEGLKAGLSLVNGLHTFMSPIFENLVEGQWIWDIRQEPENIGVGTAKARSLPCQRILTVGTDMAIGKMSTSLELNRVAKQRGINSKFIATGQAGIMISGDGIPLDAVRVDFAAGAVEGMVMKYGFEHDLLIIEGQGSLLHPGSTATLPLIRGSQPTGIVLVHKAGKKNIYRVPDILIPPLPEVVKLYEAVACAGGAFAKVRVKAIALNTSKLSDDESAKQIIEQVEQETGLPCTDVVRFDAEPLLNAVISDE